MRVRANGHPARPPLDELVGCFVMVRREVRDGKGSLAPGRVRRFWQRGLVTSADPATIRVKFSMGTAMADLVVDVDRLSGEWRRWRPGDSDAY